jgi:hypothetical protein
LKDFKFKRHLIVQVELIVLAVIASTGSNIFLVVVPYSVLFGSLCLIVGISASMRTLSTASSYLTIPLLAILFIDLPSKYLIQATSKEVLSIPVTGYL